MKILVETDDFRPSLIGLWKSTWDELKKRHPQLKVSVYVSADFSEFGKNNEKVDESKEFDDWWQERKEWVEVIPHCELHTKPPECQKEYGEQVEMIKRTLLVLGKYIDKQTLGFKASFYRMNDDCIEALRHLGFSYYNQWWNITLLKPQLRPLPTLQIVPSHTSSVQQGNPDSITSIFWKVDAKLYELETKGYTYTLAGEMVRGVTE